MRGHLRGSRALWVAILLCLCAPGVAHSEQSVTLKATLTPERLGRGTTVGFDFQVNATADLAPPPLVGVELNYPGNLGFALSGLGLATCAPAKLAVRGADGCPANSRMGFGAAVAEIQVGPLVVQEATSVAIVRAPTQGGQLALLFYADGEAPVSAQIIFPGLLAPAPAPFGGQVQIEVPLVPSFPEAPDISIVQLKSTLGPEHLTYYEHVRGRTIAYNPKGILLPRVCPRGGFQFAGAFRFADGETAQARTVVACPPHAHSKAS